MEHGLYLKKNLSWLDRTIRLIIAAVLIIWSATSFVNPWSIALLSALGGTQIVQGLTGY